MRLEASLVLKRIECLGLGEVYISKIGLELRIASYHSFMVNMSIRLSLLEVIEVELVVISIIAFVIVALGLVLFALRSQLRKYELL